MVWADHGTDVEPADVSGRAVSYHAGVAGGRMNCPLHRLITARIADSSFMTLYDYMHLALYHPQYGYYQQGALIGRAGDFITAPEISQMFGELLGLWCAHQAQAQKLTDKAILVELGAGRGILMADALRAWNRLGLHLPQVHLIETSPHLKAQQQASLTDFPALEVHWHESPKTLPDKPLLMLANEFFDALPSSNIGTKTIHGKNVASA